MVTPPKPRTKTTKRTLWRELLWRKPIAFLAMVVLFASIADWFWDEVVEPFLHIDRPRLLAIFRWLPWYAWTIVGLVTLLVMIGEHAYLLIHRAEEDLDHAEKIGTKLARDWPGDWKELAEQFKQHADSLCFAELFEESPSAVSQWKIRTFNHLRDAAGCRSLCKLAGTLLVRSPGVSTSLAAEVSAVADDVDRWLYFLKERAGLSNVLQSTSTRFGEIVGTASMGQDNEPSSGIR